MIIFILATIVIVAMQRFITCTIISVNPLPMNYFLRVSPVLATPIVSLLSMMTTMLLSSPLFPSLMESLGNGRKIMGRKPLSARSVRWYSYQCVTCWGTLSLIMIVVEDTLVWKKCQNCGVDLIGLDNVRKHMDSCHEPA